MKHRYFRTFVCTCTVHCCTEGSTQALALLGNRDERTSLRNYLQLSNRASFTELNQLARRFASNYWIPMPSKRKKYCNCRNSRCLKLCVWEHRDNKLNWRFVSIGTVNVLLRDCIVIAVTALTALTILQVLWYDVQLLSLPSSAILMRFALKSLLGLDH